MAKIRSKFDKMPALELVLENAWKNDEKPCLWILKNSGFAWERLHFSRFPVSSKSCENYSRNCLKMSPTCFKKWFGGFQKTRFINARTNHENLMKTCLQNEVKKWGVFDHFRYFFEIWVQGCPRVVPGTLPGSLQGQNCSKIDLKMTQKSSTNVVRRLSENASQRHTH